MRKGPAMLENHFWDNFRKWIPHPQVNELYDIAASGISDDGGFTILLHPDHSQETKHVKLGLRLTWDSIISYTVTDESYRPELWGTEEESNKEPWNFYISETSDHLTSFRKENYLVSENAHHFLIGGYNLILDILSDEFPTVEFVELFS